MENQSKSAFDLWAPFEPNSTITSIILVTIILASFVIYYWVTIRKLDVKEAPKGIAFFIFSMINSFKNLVFETVGPKFLKFTPYIMTLFLYIVGCNLISLLGFENPTASTSVTFSMGFITVMGTIITAIRYQKSRFFLRFLFKFSYTNKKTNKTYLIPYCFNPFGVLDFITPLLSISLRLWGNIFAGGLILSLVYSLPMLFFGKNPLVDEAGPELLIFSVFSLPFHGFLDLLIGVIQAYVFIVLTLSYWGNETTNENVPTDQVEEELKIREQGLEAWEENNIKVKLTNVGEIK